MEEKKLTGYASIDKPWLKYYTEDAINAKLPECTIYEYLWENNKTNLDDISMVYAGKKIKYCELFERIDCLSVAFSKCGLCEGDIVTIIAPSIPEVIYSFYALNKIGAISNFVDPRKSLDELDALLSTTKTKACIILDDMLGRFFDVAKKHTSTIISVSILDSLPIVPKVLLNLKKKHTLSENVISVRSLISKQKKSNERIKIEYRPNMPALIEYTGGTTGLSKGVVLSNENVNAVVEQTKYCGIPLNRGESWLSVAFPFIAYSLICSQHMPLSLGIIAQLCFDLENEKVEKQLLKGKINHMANTPLMWEQLAKSKNMQKSVLSFIIAPTVGADSLDSKKEEEINTFLKEHNCKYKLLKGYGMTEVSSGICITPTNDINKLGSVGIPLPLTNVGIFETETGKELPYGEQGEVCIQGPSIMLGYYNNDESTSNVIRKHPDGQVWLHSGDLGHIDEDGFLFIDGRLKRMIIDCTGFKIFPSIIENIIVNIKDVEKCCVVGTNDKEHNVGQVPVAFVVPNKQVEKIELKIRIENLCKQHLPTYSCPRNVIFRDDFSYTPANKIDYRMLEKEAADL